MLPTQAALVVFKECGIGLKMLPFCHAVALPRGERGEVWLVFGGTSGISCGGTGQMWRAVFERQDEEERILFQIKALLSLSLFLPLLYKSKSQYQRRLLSDTVHCTDSLMSSREWLPNTSVECEGEQHGEEQYIPEDNWSWDSSTETLQRMVQAADNLFQVQDYFERSKQIVK